MDCALFECPTAWKPWLPSGVRGLAQKEELTEQTWDLLALTPAGLLRTEKGLVHCRILLLPGGCPLELAAEIRAEQVITYGLSSRDSLTLSSLENPVLCVQRTLPRPDGGVVEPQEFPLRNLPAPAEELLPLLGLRVLRMQLTDDAILW